MPDLRIEPEQGVASGCEWVVMAGLGTRLMPVVEAEESTELLEVESVSQGMAAVVAAVVEDYRANMLAVAYWSREKHCTAVVTMAELEFAAAGIAIAAAAVEDMR